MNKIKTMIGHQGLKRYFFNTSWTLATQGVRLLAGFFVGLWVARFLGPSDFGTYNYLISLISIFSAFASFGTNEQLVTDLVRHPEETTSFLNAAFYLRIFLGLLSIIVIFIISTLSTEFKNVQVYLLISTPIIIFQTFDLVDVYYRATINLKASSITRIFQILISSIIKIYLIKTNAPLISFFYVMTFDYASYAILIYISFKKLEPGFILMMPNAAYVKRIVASCWPLMFMIVSNSVLSKLDHVLIGNFLAKSDVGYYSSSSRILELLGTFPTLMFSSLYTAILNAKKHSQEEYYNRLYKLSRFLRWISILAAIFFSFFSLEIITLLFGASYAAAAPILRIHSFSFIFFTMSMVSIHWYIAEGLNELLMIKTILAGLTNMTLNLVLIPRYGVNGAVYSSLITYAFFYGLYDYLNPKTRNSFYINSDIARFLFKK